MNFEIGEIAIFQNSRIDPNRDGEECVIFGPFKMRTLSKPYPDGRTTVLCWLVVFLSDPLIVYAALPDQLRKKRPPQDWIKLCHLNEIRELVKL